MDAGREMDMQVHKALYPEHSIYPGYEGTWWCGVRNGLLGYVKAGRRLPEYSTDLGAWPVLPAAEWAVWTRDNKPGYICVEIEWEKWADPATSLDHLTDCEIEIGEGTWQQAVALGLATCVLQWKEAGGE